MEINDSNFQEEVIEASENMPVLVDFWAAWCGPCKMLKPIIEKLSLEYKDKVKIVALNVEENQEKAGEYGIMSIPNVKLFKKGEVVDEFLGVMPEEAVKSWIDERI